MRLDVRFQGNGLKPLAQDFRGRNAPQAKARGEKVVIGILADMVEIRFALTDEASQGSENFVLLDLGHFGRRQPVNQSVQTGDSSHFGDKGKPDMADGRSRVSLDIGDEHFVLPHPLGVCWITRFVSSIYRYC